MLTNHPYPHRPITQDEIDALMRQARVERAKAARELFRALFHRKPAADEARTGPSLSAAASR
jgi:hypothetical protein